LNRSNRPYLVEEERAVQTIVLDPELRAKLKGLDQEVEFRDESGKTLGHSVPKALYRNMLYAAVRAACPRSKKEQELRRRETGGRPLAEFWKSLGVK
jgi:hypothetical protein